MRTDVSARVGRAGRARAGNAPAPATAIRDSIRRRVTTRPSPLLSPTSTAHTPYSFGTSPDTMLPYGHAR